MCYEKNSDNRKIFLCEGEISKDGCFGHEKNKIEISLLFSIKIIPKNKNHPEKVHKNKNVENILQNSAKI